jgi:hypothetical protein
VRGLILGRRFWEFYLVRYLAGTILGILIIMYLSINYSTQISSKLLGTYDAQHSSGSLPNDNVINMAYGMLFQSTDQVSLTRDLQSEQIKLLGKNTAVSLRSLAQNNPSSPRYGEVDITTTDMTVLSSVIMATLGFLYMYVFSAAILFLHTVRGLFGLPKSPLHGFYRRLSTGRTSSDIMDVSPSGRTTKHRSTRELMNSAEDKKSPISEYVESYRHLREHGNAFGIILSELFLARLLTWFNFSLWVLVIWSIVGFISWIAGTYLEIRLVRLTPRIDRAQR